ncbi:hypothetical protein ACLOJK_014486 [Asimina triloba]
MKCWRFGEYIIVGPILARPQRDTSNESVTAAEEQLSQESGVEFKNARAAIDVMESKKVGRRAASAGERVYRCDYLDIPSRFPFRSLHDFAEAWSAFSLYFSGVFSYGKGN